MTNKEYRTNAWPNGAFHQSQIADYCACPFKFYMKYVLGMEPETIGTKMFFGTVMHKAIADLHATEKIPHLAETIKRCETEENRPVFWDDKKVEIEKFIDDAIPTLTNYWNKPFNRDAEILLAEAEFEVDIGKFKFGGRIDQLRRYQDETILIDFKTGAAQTNEHLIEIDYQLSIYAYSIDYGRFVGNKGWNLDKVAIYRTQDHLPYKKKTTKKSTGEVFMAGDERGPGLYTTTRHPKDFEAMIQDLSTICRNIVGPHFDDKVGHLVKGGAFGRTPNIMSCQMCGLKAECLAARKQAIIDTTNITIDEEDIINV